MPEPADLAEFVRAESAALLRFAWALCGNWSTAEDLVQTALAATWPRWGALTRADRPELYVRKVIVTTYLRWQRRRWSGEIPTQDFADSTDRSDDTAASDTRHALLSALRRLPPRQRAVIVLSYFLDLSEADTAQVLDCSVGTVKRQKHAALNRLRAQPELAATFAGEAF